MMGKGGKGKRIFTAANGKGHFWLREQREMEPVFIDHFLIVWRGCGGNSIIHWRMRQMQSLHMKSYSRERGQLSILHISWANKSI